LRTTLKLIITA